MKKFFLFLFLLPISLYSFSQFFNYAYGPVFPYPGSGVGKILSVKDGGIMYLQVNTDSFIHVQYYEPKYRALTLQDIKIPFFPVKHAQIENIFSFNGDAQVFISGGGTDSTMLYRITINGLTGKLKEAVVVQNIHHLKQGKVTGSENYYPQFIVRQSANGNAYAIAAVNPSKYDNLPVIQLSVYDTLGNELKRPYKSDLPEKFNNLSPVDLVVISPDQAALLTYGFTEQNDMKDGDLIMAMVEKLKPDLRLKELYFSNDLILKRGVARYDSAFKKIFLLSATSKQSLRGLAVTDLVRIDVPTMKIDNDANLVFNQKTAAKLGQITGEEKPLFTPVDFFLKGLTNYQVIYQQLIPRSQKDTFEHAKINHTVFAEFDADNNMISSYIIPSFTEMKGAEISPFYLHDLELKGVPFLYGNQYRTGKLLSDDYHFFWVQNDVATNFMSTDGTKLAEFKDNSKGASFYFELSGGNILPRRQFLAGKPTDKGGTHLLVPGVGYFDKLNGTWVTLQEEAKEEYPGLKLVWLQP